MGRLTETVAELERTVDAHGWDQPGRLYALVETADLLAREPQLGARLGLRPGPAGSLTAVEQDELAEPLEELLGRISWPEQVHGVAVVQEVVVLPPHLEAAVPTTGDVAAWAASQPDRREVRMAVGVLRTGDQASVLRVRGEEEVLSGPDLAPNLVAALRASLA